MIWHECSIDSVGKTQDAKKSWGIGEGKWGRRFGRLYDYIHVRYNIPASPKQNASKYVSRPSTLIKMGVVVSSGALSWQVQGVRHFSSVFSRGTFFRVSDSYSHLSGQHGEQLPELNKPRRPYSLCSARKYLLHLHLRLLRGGLRTTSSV